MKDDHWAIRTGAEAASAGAQEGKRGVIHLLVERKRHALIRRGYVRLGHGDSAPALRVLEAESSSGVRRAGYDEPEGHGDEEDWSKHRTLLLDAPEHQSASNNAYWKCNTKKADGGDLRWHLENA